MGILDDAIKEHLELKRQHGADDSELKQLEDEAFGAAERPGKGGSTPDPLAEAPTEFMSQPDLEPDEAGEVAAAAPKPETEEAPGRRSPRSEIADLQEAPPSEPDASAPEPEAPAEEESPAMEHEAVPEPAPSSEPDPTPEPEISTGPTTEEREAIAEQPTEMFDIEEELASSQAEAPSEEELIEEEMDEPRLAPVDPLAGLDDEVAEVKIEEDEEDDDFWDEKRLSDELNQALEAPSEVEEGDAATELYEDAADEGEATGEESPASQPDEDVLEETPDFLEEAPEDDQLWFEQKPPKDFDFDD
jgi:CapZ-interacting protein